MSESSKHGQTHVQEQVGRLNGQTYRGKDSLGKKSTVDGQVERTRAKLAGLSKKQFKELEENSTAIIGVRRYLLAHLRQGHPRDVKFSQIGLKEIRDELFMILIAISTRRIPPVTNCRIAMWPGDV